MQPKTILTTAALNGFFVTGLAALGTHALQLANKDATLFQKAIEFHYTHIFALIACAVLAKWDQKVWAGRAATLFLLGILCFSASLYWRAIMGAGSLGAFHWVTPIGGLALMGGWLALAFGAWTRKPAS